MTRNLFDRDSVELPIPIHATSPFAIAMNYLPIDKSNICRSLQRAIALLAYSYSGLIIGYLLLRVIFWDRLSLVAFLGLFVPLLLLPIFLLPAIAFSIVKKRWFFILSSLACLWLIGWLHLTYWSPQPVTNSGSESLKVLSLNNSWNKTTPESLVNLIVRQNPDLVCLQETTGYHYREALPKLKASYPYQIRGPWAAIISKYPLRFHQTIHLAGHREEQQRAAIRWHQQDIVVYNISTISPWIRYHQVLPFLKIPRYEYAERSAEIQDLIGRLSHEIYPVIAAGDFNMTDQSQDYHNLQTAIEDSFRESGFGFGFTWPQGWELGYLLKDSNSKLNYPLFRIDYIWYSQHWGSEYTKVLPTTGSDHLPLEAKLHL